MRSPYIPGAENYTPDAAAIDREEHEELSAREAYLADLEAADFAAWDIRQRVFRRLCAHFFSAGPQPEEVLQRVFAAALDRRPDLLRGLDAQAQRLAAEESVRGRRWRLRAIFDGRGEHWFAAYKDAAATLASAFHSARRPELCRVTLNEALSGGGVEPEEATETLSRVLERIFRGGASPRAVAQQTFALTGWLFRDLQWNMSLDSLGRLFAEQRASQSWRTKEFVESMLRRAGFVGVKAPWQKPETACDKYRAAARGNQNRRRSRRRFRVLPLSSLSPLIETTNPQTIATNHAVYSRRSTEPRTTGDVPREVAT